MAKLTEKVMGSITMDGSWVGQSHYLHNPCVLICPFEGDKCKHAKHRLNRVGGIMAASRNCTRTGRSATKRTRRLACLRSAGAQ
eukprot:6250189-Prymnesium_polylepis.1